jgi:hypothetical protein
MRYLAICILSLGSVFSAASSPTPVAAIVPVLESSVRDAAFVRASLEGAPGDSAAFDMLLMVMVAGALAALQLRRRQRSLRMPALRL